MIVISRCPHRISLLGGGSDLKWFLEKHDIGFSIGFSIPIFSRVVLSYRSNNAPHGILNYSSREEYSDLNSICHPIIRNCLQTLEIKQPVELASFGEPFSGSGLGSSSSFTIALLKGIYALNNQEISNNEIAELACKIEIEKMNQPIGSQDQYLCALGGVNILEFSKNKNVIRKNSDHITEAVKKFMENTFLLNTGINRSASKVLNEIRSRSENFENIKEIYNVAKEFFNKDNSDPIKAVNQLEEAVIKSWNLKKNMPGTMNQKLIEIESYVEMNNFKILKLLGAGGGGYFLVKYCGDNIENDKKSLLEKNFNLVDVAISHSGCEYWKI